ncbi:hypothetical protein PR048_003831 [Dryococelus australis]|uniref:Uncharacterized protein n=1 Tax=Dryococelus australis TaxID=614101 RepID=A0ABQ9IP42_9NEOP|nr:hypothetical protein PR048_003831 [Dryococelus australis]
MLLLQLLEKHMDQALRKQRELVVHELDIPKLSDFRDFLEKHCMTSKVVVGTSRNPFQKNVAFVRAIIPSTDTLNLCKRTLRSVFQWQRANDYVSSK